MPIVTYEEQIRIQRANGLREHDKCLKGQGCSVYGTDEEGYKGKTYADVAQEPLRINRVCPDAKVIVPVTPAFVIEEQPRVHNITYKPAPYRVVDFNPCDGKNHVLDTIPDGQDVDIEYAVSTETHGMTVQDTKFADPYPVKTVKKGLEKVEVTNSVIDTNGTSAVEKTTEDGKNVSKEETTER